MSKAFTDEENADTTVRGRRPERAAPGDERPITPGGHRRLSEQLAHLVDVERPAALALLDAVAREERLRDLDHRQALLEATLASVRIVKPPDSPQIVAFGARVTLAWDDGRRQQLRLVGPDEVDPREGDVSIDAPIARALLGLSVGDVAEVRLPRGTVEAEVVSIA